MGVKEDFRGMSSVAGGDGDDDGGLALCGGSVIAYISVNKSKFLANHMTNTDLTTRLDGGVGYQTVEICFRRELRGV